MQCNAELKGHRAHYVVRTVRGNIAEMPLSLGPNNIHRH